MVTLYYTLSMGNVFFHIDLDAFFASCEILEHPEWKGKALIIGGKSPRSVVSTCSYEARKYGVHSAMPMSIALRKCPDAIVKEPDFHLYSRLSKSVMDLLSSFAPGFLQVSIDEAFLDLSGMNKIYPLPGKAAKELKEKIVKKTGLTVSIGVASSRYVAKLASDYHKPDGLTIVPPGKEEEFVDKVGLEKLWGIGNSTLESLQKRGIRTTETLRKWTMEELKRSFGESSGEFLYKVSRGIDPGIHEKEALSHSISEEETFIYDVYDEEIIKEKLLEMSENLQLRALDEKKVPKTVTVKIRYGDFKTVTISKTPQSPLYSSLDIFDIALFLFQSKYEKKGVRLIGLSLGSLYDGEEIEERELFYEEGERRRTLDKTILSLKKDGNKIIKASILKKPT